MNRRKAVLIGILAVLLTACSYWRHSSMAAERKAAGAAIEDLIICRRIADGINQYRRQPTLASEQEQLAEQTTSLIEKAAMAAKIEKRDLVRITPEPAQRIGNTVYREKPSGVFLRNITLRQLVGFVHHLMESGFRAKMIRLTAPKPEDTGSLWTVELTVTYLVYDPVISNK
jgi:hypothetical protein